MSPPEWILFGAIADQVVELGYAWTCDAGDGKPCAFIDLNEPTPGASPLDALIRAIDAAPTIEDDDLLILRELYRPA